MASFEVLKSSYAKLWDSMDVRHDRMPEAKRDAERVLAGKSRYQDVQARTGVPWWFVGLCHYRESNCNFETYLGNGQSLHRRTTIVPKGRGPFTGPSAFLDGAVDALRLEGFVGARDWSIARILYRLEGFNGYGYHAKGVNSPYLWGGSSAYGPPNALGGKYVRDHVFDPHFVDSQLGTAVILKALMELDTTITLNGQHMSDVEAAREPDEELTDSTLWIQQALNRLGALPHLIEDGKNGPNTRTAVSHFQQRSGLQDTGLADVRTIAALHDTVRATTVSDSDAIRKRVEELERQLASRMTQPILIHPAEPGLPEASQASSNIDSLTARVSELMHRIERGVGFPVSELVSPETEQISPLRQIIEDSTSKSREVVPRLEPGQIISMLSELDSKRPLGQINGALGETLGNLLNGKKTAIGIIGAIATQILSQVPVNTGLGQVIAQLTPAAGMSPYSLPIFLGITVWGFLGKIEKLRQPIVVASD